MGSQTRRLRRQRERNEAVERELADEAEHRHVVEVDGGIIVYSDGQERELAALTELRTAPDVFGVVARVESAFRVPDQIRDTVLEERLKR